LIVGAEEGKVPLIWLQTQRAEASCWVSYWLAFFPTDATGS